MATKKKIVSKKKYPKGIPDPRNIKKGTQQEKVALINFDQKSAIEKIMGDTSFMMVAFRKNDDLLLHTSKEDPSMTALGQSVSQHMIQKGCVFLLE